MSMVCVQLEGDPQQVRGVGVVWEGYSSINMNTNRERMASGVLPWKNQTPTQTSTKPN